MQILLLIEINFVLMGINQEEIQINSLSLKSISAFSLSERVGPRIFRMFSGASANSEIYVTATPTRHTELPSSEIPPGNLPSTIYLLPTLPNVQQRECPDNGFYAINYKRKIPCKFNRHSTAINFVFHNL